MDLDQLREQACVQLRLLLPQAGDSSRLVDECLTSARKAFRDEFILQLSPAAWARISLIYIKNFLDTGCDVPVGALVAQVLRDALHTGRMDMLSQQAATEAQAFTPPPAAKKSGPSLSVVRDT